MTNLQKIYKFNTSNFLPSRHIGFDRWADLFEMLETPEYKATSFPPHNIIKTSQYNYVLELAVAGFTNNDIEITSEKNKLIISGEIKEKEDTEYIYHGIAGRSFTKTFTLLDTIVVQGASLQDGILKVHLMDCIPESYKPKKIPIDNKLELVSDKKLLVE